MLLEGSGCPGGGSALLNELLAWRVRAVLLPPHPAAVSVLFIPLELVCGLIPLPPSCWGLPQAGMFCDFQGLLFTVEGKSCAYLFTWGAGGFSCCLPWLVHTDYPQA